MSETYTLTPYARKHRSAVQDLCFQHARVHIQIDWYALETWLDAPDVHAWLAWQGGTLAALLAVSAPQDGAVWLRLVALHDSLRAPEDVLPRLWAQVAPPRGAVLVMRDWLADYLPAMGFRYDEHIITLRRGGSVLPPLGVHTDVQLRPALGDDLDTLLALDHAAFAAPWRMPRAELRDALRAAASCTLALHDGTPIGYQLATQVRDAAHLARLAVLPGEQGHGIGAALLHHVLTHFARRSVYVVTVNTQQSNQHALRLYTRFGFQRTGHDVAVWQAR